MDEQRQTVIVTGNSGLLGKGVVRQLAEQYHIVGIDIVEPDSALPEHASFIKCDLTEQSSVNETLEQVRQRHGDRIASVVHLAAYVDFSGEPSDKYDEVTVQGTEHLLTALQPLNVEQFIFSSTMLVHAPTRPGEPINEDSPIQPTWAYPESKVKTERVVHEHRGRIPAVVLRIAGVYDDYGHSLPLSQQIQRIYEKQLTGQVFPGDASHGQALVHYDDMVEAFRLTIERRHDLPEELTLLIGEPEPMSYEDLQRAIGELIHGEPWETRRIPKPLARTGAWFQLKLAGENVPFIRPWMIDRADDHYELDITRAKHTIGWAPRHHLRDSLPKIVDALKSDPVTWYHEHKLTLPPSLEQRAKAG